MSELGTRYNEDKPRWHLLLPSFIADGLCVAPNAELDLGALLDVYNDLMIHEHPWTQATQIWQKTLAAVMTKYDCTVWEAMEMCIAVLEFGCKKYDSWNWAKGLVWSNPLDSAIRHIRQMSDDILTDEESGLPHGGHLLCNAYFLSHMMRYRADLNDLPGAKIRSIQLDYT